MSTPYEFDSHGNVVRSGRHEIGRYVDVSGLGERRVVRFPKEISWVETASAFWRRTIGKGWAEKEAQFCDTNGHMSCLLHGIDEAVEQARKLELDGSTALVCVEAVLQVVNTPCIPSTATPWLRGPHARRWMQCPDDWMLASDDEIRIWNRATYEERETLPMIFLRKESVHDIVVWSSMDLGFPVEEQLRRIEDRLRPVFERRALRDGDLTVERVLSTARHALSRMGAEAA